MIYSNNIEGSGTFLVLHLSQIFQLQAQIIQLIQRLLVDDFFDSFLLYFWFWTSGCRWFTEFLDAQLFLCNQFGLHQVILQLDCLVDFGTHFRLLGRAACLNQVFDFDVEIIIVVMNVFDELHMLIEFDFNFLQNFNWCLCIQLDIFVSFQVPVNSFDVNSQGWH